MTVQEKIQLVLNVIDGKARPSELKPILDEPSEVNIFRAAVDHIVGKVLRERENNRAQFRFKIVEQGRESFTDWAPELSQFSAGWAMNQLRLDRPHAEISVERKY
jgi:hypothetical protein